MSEALLKSLSARVRALRLHRRLSQEDLADSAGIHRTYLSSLERGRRNATVVTLAKVAKALGVHVVDLLSSDRPAMLKGKKST